MADQNGQPTSSWGDALGPAGAPVTIDALGRKWTFLKDIPLVFSHAEELTIEWGRDRMRRKLTAYIDRHDPNSPDFHKAEAAKDEFADRIEKGYYRPPNGEGYRAYQETDEGKLVMLVAAMRPAHPDATAGTVMEIMAADPDNFSLLMRQLAGKVAAFGRVGERMKATHQDSPTPSS